MENLPKPSLSSWLTHVDNYITVAAALEAVETHGEADITTLSCATGFYYARKLDIFLHDEKQRNYDEEFLMKKLTHANINALTKNADDFFEQDGKGTSLETSQMASSKGLSVWKKYGRLKRVIMNEDIPLWNKLIKKNSGLQLEDLILLFRKRKFYNAVEEKLIKGNHEEICEEYSSDQGPLTQNDINKSHYLLNFTDDYYSPSFWVFKMFGPPSSPFDSVIFRAQLSNGPKKVESQTAPSTSLMMAAAGGPPNLSEGRGVGDPPPSMSRAEIRNEERMRYEVEEERRRHDDMLQVSMYGFAMEEYHADVEVRKQKIDECERKIALLQKMGRLVEATVATEELLQLYSTAFPQKPEKLVLKNPLTEAPHHQRMKRQRTAHRSSVPSPSTLSMDTPSSSSSSVAKNYDAIS